MLGTTDSHVCASADGGQHWRSVLDRVDWPTFVRVTPDAVIVRTGVEPDSVAPGVRWVARRTGEHWTPLAPGESVGTTNGEVRRHVTAYGIEGDYVPTARCGDVLYLSAQGAGPRPTLALRSADDGVTWRLVTLPWVVNESGVDFQCAGPGVMAVDHGDPSTPTAAYSMDGGANWRAIHLPPYDDRQRSTGRGCTGWGDRTLVCERDSHVWATEDTGRHWHRAGSPTGGRTLVEADGHLLGLGNGIAQSRSTGRKWTLTATAPGRYNLGTRGGALTARTFWLAGTALWWTDDAGGHWLATLLSQELVAVLGRRRLVGLSHRRCADTACGSDLLLSTDGGRSWHDIALGEIHDAWQEGDTVRVTTGGDRPRTMVSRDGVTWRDTEPLPPGAEGSEYAEFSVVQAGGVEVRLTNGELQLLSPFDPVEVIARGWPRDTPPMMAHAAHGRVDAVVFGNGTVLRRR